MTGDDVFTQFVFLCVGAVFSLIGSAIVTLLWNEIRKPRLSIRISDRPHDNCDPSSSIKERFLLAEVVNSPLPHWLQRIRREAALQCNGKISYCTENGVEVFSKPVELLWTDIEPPRPLIVLQDGAKAVEVFNPAAYTVANRVDVHAGDTEEVKKFHVAVRFADEKDCFGFGADQYLRSQTWHDQRDLRLAHGRVYFAKITVVSAGEEVRKTLRIINESGIEHFRLDDQS